MFAVRDRRTGKFLKYSTYGEYQAFRQALGHEPTKQERHDNLYRLDSPEHAQLWKTKGGVKKSFFPERFLGYTYYTDKHGFHRNRPISIPIEEALPWLEIVEVEITVGYKK